MLQTSVFIMSHYAYALVGQMYGTDGMRMQGEAIQRWESIGEDFNVVIVWIR